MNKFNVNNELVKSVPRKAGKIHILSEFLIMEFDLMIVHKMKHDCLICASMALTQYPYIRYVYLVTCYSLKIKILFDIEYTMQEQ